MIAALVAAIMPFVLYVPDELHDIDVDGFTAELLTAASEPVGDHPPCSCVVLPRV